MCCAIVAAKVPLSGFQGENLVERLDPRLGWYEGPTLLQVIDNLRPPTRRSDLPTRLTVSDIFKTPGLGGCVAGKIEAGAVEAGHSLVFRPGDTVGQVRAVEKHGRRVTSGWAGDSVVIALQGVDLDTVRVGHVLCDAKCPIPLVTSFYAQILTFDIPVPLTKGSHVVPQHRVNCSVFVAYWNHEVGSPYTVA